MQKPRVLIIDNYDSFTYNLVNILRKGTKPEFVLVHNDTVDLRAIAEFDKILFSPGPDVPRQGNTMWQVLDAYKTSKDILGVCLGFQAIGLYFGARLFNLPTVVHGQTREIEILDNRVGLFKNIATPFVGGLYHSWGISRESFPDILRVTAQSTDKQIMAIQHKTYKISGLQFHPESMMTPLGEQIIENWLNL
jgi:anthranilate synthase component 2